MYPDNGLGFSCNCPDGFHYPMTCGEYMLVWIWTCFTLSDEASVSYGNQTSCVNFVNSNRSHRILI